MLGSEAFLAKLVSLAKPTKRTPKPLKRKSQLSPEQIIAFVAEQNGELPESYQGSRATAPGRELAALLCRELTTKSLAELSRAFGLGHPDSSANLIKRARKLTSESQKVNKTHRQQKSEILKTENQVWP